MGQTFLLLRYVNTACLVLPDVDTSYIGFSFPTKEELEYSFEVVPAKDLWLKP